jgi:dipeptidyl aminopeptidase/acylaminoacyl peptidase
MFLWPTSLHLSRLQSSPAYTISIAPRVALFFFRASLLNLGRAFRQILLEQVTLVRRKPFLRFVPIVLLSGIVPSIALSHAQGNPPPAKTEPWKPEDVIYAETINDFSISPDARSVVWVRGEGDKEKDERVSNLFLSSLTEDRTTQLTRGNASVSLPAWSPDSEWIAFLSSRPLPDAKPDVAKTQIWLISAHGGEPYALTELLRAPRRVQWLDKDNLIFSAEEDPSAYEQAEKKKKDDSEVVDDAEHQPPVRLFKISVKDKKITRLTTNSDWIAQWSASKDGKYVVAVHDKSLHYTFDQKVPPITILHNLTDGTEKQIFTEGRTHPDLLAWAPDNSGFYAQASFSNDPKFLTATIQLLYFYDLAGNNSVQVPLDWENGAGRDLHTTSDGFVSHLAAGAHDDIAHYTREKSGDAWAWKHATLEGDNAQNIQFFDVSEDSKTLVYQSSSASRMPQLFRSQINGNQIASSSQLTKLNENLVKSRTFSKSEVIRWKGSNGEEVEGILRYPANYDPDKKYPVITAVHGGPAGADMDAWRDSWAYPYQLLTQRDAFVLSPNYHGSGNYGLKWVESICCGNYYDLETPDINMGVDFLIQKGLVDPDKVATMGWSNGSILSTSLITTYPSRYKVASVGAGDVEWISDWGNVIFGDSFDSYYFGKSPMQDPELYIRKSPFFKMDKVQAPVLIFHGTADNQVPPSQSWSYFRVLQYYGKVPVKFVVFPGEPHGPRKLTHQTRKVDEEMAWFDQYFFKTTPPENEALKAGSPLDTALRTKTVARSGAAYGAAYTQKGKSILIPEVVKRGDLEIGRFEVTRAQFAAFDKSYKFDPGTENYPANGITFELAKAYADWLSKLTGQTWRVPNSSEVSSMLNKKDGENTLDYWAGYPANPDDAARLREKLKELPGSAPLLKPVGDFPPQGQGDETRIFDLGGNVAEWVVMPDGSGKAAGGSADCPADARSNCAPASEYIGFRVVRGSAKPPSANAKD